MTVEYRFVVWVGTTRPRRLDHGILYAWESDDRVNQFLKIIKRLFL